jgi:hypothetical protein
MACCLIAMMVLAHCLATLRRWGAFWGFVAVPEGVQYDTLMDHVRRWSARRDVRLAALALAVVELSALSAWVSLRHGDHVRQFVEIAICTAQGDTRPLRVALDGTRPLALLGD